MELDIDSVGDRPATKSRIEEIEVTPEMIEAGLAALYRFPITEPFESEMRKAVECIKL
jgi:hypothetical protein